ncbi:MAG: hypothetical protein ACKVW3_01855 [Phycisphaerales bacterium]
MGGIPPSTTELQKATPGTPRDLGDANMAERGLSFGVVRDGAPVGKIDAVWVVVILPAGFTGGPLDVPHKLGRTPSLVAKVMDEGLGTCSARAINRDGWSPSNVRVDIYFISGSLDNLALTFLVGG